MYYTNFIATNIFLWLISKLKNFKCEKLTIIWFLIHYIASKHREMFTASFLTKIGFVRFATCQYVTKPRYFLRSGGNLLQIYWNRRMLMIKSWHWVWWFWEKFWCLIPPIDDLILTGDFPVLYCLSIVSLVSGIISCHLKKYRINNLMILKL